MANSLKFVLIPLTIALLAAIVYCVLGPHSYMSRIWWIPDWIGQWADRHPFFRNFPPFAALAALLFFVASLLRPMTANCLLNTSAPAPTRRFQWRRALFCFIAVALLGTALEFLQQMVPERKEYAHPWQIMWSVAGAFVGSFGAALLMRLFYTSNGVDLPTDAQKGDGLAQP